MALLDSACNMFGPLDDRLKEQIREFLDDPTVEKWDRIHGIVIRYSPTFTVWQALVHADATYADIATTYSVAGKKVRPHPEELWTRVPDPFTLRRGIKVVLALPYQNVVDNKR